MIHPDASVDECMEEISALEAEVDKLLAQIVDMGDRVRRLEAMIEPMRMETLRKDP
jgi:hypothetical protein